MAIRAPSRSHAPADLPARWTQARSCRAMASRRPRSNAQRAPLPAPRSRSLAGSSTSCPHWVLAPEVSFSDLPRARRRRHVAWHPGRRAILVIELKTDIVDVNQLIGKVGEKARLIRKIVRDRGWDPLTVSTWVIVAGRQDQPRPIGGAPDPCSAPRSRPMAEPSGPGSRTRSARSRPSPAGRSSPPASSRRRGGFGGVRRAG